MELLLIVETDLHSYQAFQSFRRIHKLRIQLLKLLRINHKLYTDTGDIWSLTSTKKNIKNKQMRESM